MEDLMGQINNMIENRGIGIKKISTVGKYLEEKVKNEQEIEELD